MPTYEYRCKGCGHEFELFQMMTDDPVSTCPECGGEVERLIGTGAGLLFKGDGFYITDYRSESYKQAQKKDSDSAQSKSADTTKKSASKKNETTKA